MPFPYRKILCPVDFHENSAKAVAEAAALALPSGATLCLFHVVHINPLAAQGAAEGYAAGGLYDSQIEHARAQVDEFARKLPAGVKHEVEIFLGEPGYTIVTEAKKLGADLIVMATHGRHGIVHLVLGSVAERVVREASVPVLTVSPSAEK